MSKRLALAVQWLLIAYVAPKSTPRPKFPPKSAFPSNFPPVASPSKDAIPEVSTITLASSTICS